MAKVSPLKSDFSGGEYDPKLFGRVDHERYKMGLSRCKNYIPLMQGPVTRRPGTYYAGQARGSGSVLIPFQFSLAQSYILEFSGGFVRFWLNYGQVLSGGVPYEIATPYSDAEMPQVRWTQNADILYLVHPNHIPWALVRVGPTNWFITAVQVTNRGPYLPSLPLSSSVGTVTTDRPHLTFTNPGSGLISTLTATTAFGAPFFDLADGGTFGRAIMLNFPSPTNSWAMFKIITVTSTTQATVEQILDTLFTIQLGSGVPDPTDYRFGVWSQTNGYPAAVAFYEDRLVFSGVPQFPQRIDGSRTADYTNFTPVNPDGSVPDNCSYSFTMNSNQLDSIEWLSSDEQSLLAGSSGGEWSVRSSINGEALTPSNVNAKKTTYWGSSSPSPIKAGKATMHVQRGGMRLRELMYRFEYSGYISTELTELANHLTSGTRDQNITRGLKTLAYQQNPYQIIWALRNDGQLLGTTYDHDGNSLRIGWHQHELGGVSDSSASPPIILSMAVIPSPDLTRDDLWMVVQRYIGGAAVTYIEYAGKFFEDTDDQKDAHQLDCGLMYNVPLTVTAISLANPAVVTSAAHGLSNGDTVILDHVLGMTQVNGLTFTIAGVTTNTFQLSGYDSTTLKIGVGGSVRKKVSTISGLSHLNGETVSIYADGDVQLDKVVSSGTITLDQPSAVVHVGYNFQSDIRLMPIEAGAVSGTALGKTRRTQRVALYLHRGLGIKFGYGFDRLDDYIFETLQEPAGSGPRLVTDILNLETDSDYDLFNRFCIRQDTPFPGTILAVAPIMETQER